MDLSKIQNNLPAKDKKTIEVAKKLFDTYDNVCGNDECLINSILIYYQLHELIKNLTINKQYDIVCEMVIIGIGIEKNIYTKIVDSYDSEKQTDNEVKSLGT